jgi:hypothetical protein
MLESVHQVNSVRASQSNNTDKTRNGPGLDNGHASASGTILMFDQKGAEERDLHPASWAWHAAPQHVLNSAH